MPDYKAVPAGELQVTAQLPFWGGVSLLLPMRSMALFAGRAHAADGRPNSKQAAPEDSLRLAW